MADAIRDVIIRLNLEAGNIPEIRLPGAQEVRASFEAMQTGFRSIRETAAEAAREVQTVADVVRRQQQAAQDASRVVESIALQNRSMQELRATIDQVVAGMQQMGAANGLQQSVSQIEALRKELERAAEARRELDAGGGGLPGAGGPGLGGGGSGGVPGGGPPDTSAEEMARRLEEFQAAAERAAESVRQMVEEGRSIGEITPHIDAMIEAIGTEAANQLGLTAEEVANLRAELQQLAATELQRVQQETERAARAQQQLQQRTAAAWRQVGGGITGATQAAAKFAQMIALVDSSKSESVEQLVRSFVRISAVSEGMNSVQEGLNRFSQSLGGVATLATAAAARQTALAGANTAVATSLTLVGRAAGMAQAAMGPLGAVISVASLAIIGLTAYNQLFGESAEDAAKKAEEGQQRYAEAIQRSRDQLARQIEQIRGQNELISEQFRLRALGNKGKVTVAEIAQEGATERAASRALAQTKIRDIVEEELGKGTAPKAEERKGAAFTRVRELEEKLQSLTESLSRPVTGPNSGQNFAATQEAAVRTEKELIAARAELERARKEFDQQQQQRKFAKEFSGQNLVAAAQTAQQLPENVRTPIMEQIRAAALAEAKLVSDQITAARGQLETLKSEGESAKGKISGAEAGLASGFDRALRLRDPQIMQRLQRDLSRASETQDIRRRGERFDQFFANYGDK
ncbi:MAG: hypothetical protein E6Q97_30110, partial [Desulfurellales bacterium]